MSEPYEYETKLARMELLQRAIVLSDGQQEELDDLISWVVKYEAAHANLPRFDA
jgi:hypothetical protein